MFERFDDPEAFVPDDRFRTAVQVRGRRFKRRRRIGQVAAGTVAVVALATGGIGLYVARRDAAIDRVDVATRPSTDGAVNILLLGSDERPPDDPDGVNGARADTIAILRMDEIGDHLLSIPRDLVDADGRRVNQGLNDGVQGMVDAVTRTTGIPIDHVVVLDFDGFGALVDAVGGLEVMVTMPVRDERAGLALEPSSCTSLDGDTTLDLVRARHLETRTTSGTWVVDPSGDIGRITRQQAVLGLALNQLGTDLGTVDRLSRLLADHAVVDDGLSLGRLVELGRRLAGGPGLETMTLPAEASTLASGAAVLVPTADTAAYEKAFGADVEAGPIPVGLNPGPPPGQVPIAPCG